MTQGQRAYFTIVDLLFYTEKSEHDALPLCSPGPDGRAGLPRAPGAESGLLASCVY